MKRRDEAGYSLLHLLIFTTVMIPILLAIAGTGSAVGSTVSVLEGRATAVDVCQITQQKVARLLRPLALSSIEIRVDEDYKAALEAKYSPATVEVEEEEEEEELEDEEGEVEGSGGDSIIGAVGDGLTIDGDGSPDSLVDFVTSAIPLLANFESLLTTNIQAANVVILEEEDPLPVPEDGLREGAWGFGLGGEPINPPTVGSWVAPLGGLPFRTLRFKSVPEGSPYATLVPSSVITENSIQLEFVLDPGEIENRMDDDGDGLIDEGSLVLLKGLQQERHILASGLEQCRFLLAGRSLIFALSSARVDQKGHVHRAQSVRTFYLRGN